VAPFQERGLEFDGQQFLDKGNILVDELFLEGDGVGRDDRLAPRPHRVEGGRDEIGQRFSDAGSGFDDQMTARPKGPRHLACHALLLGPVFIVRRSGKTTLRRKHLLDLQLEGTAHRVSGILSQRDHEGNGGQLTESKRAISD
jgi:hypothetical protein